eukprot:11179175-Lingulodinium_polyedra.AAC.1
MGPSPGQASKYRRAGATEWATAEWMTAGRGAQRGGPRSGGPRIWGPRGGEGRSSRPTPIPLLREPFTCQ